MSLAEQLATKTILVVDDLADNAELLRILLEKLYRVKVALNGPKALEIANAKIPPDLILLDITMPGMDGFEVCQKLKGNPKTRDIPVLFITAMAEPETILRGFQLGALDYITKPFQREVLRARVKIHLAQRIYNRAIAEMKGKLEESNDVKSQLLKLVTDQVTPFTIQVLQTSREVQKELDFKSHWMTKELTKEAQKALALLRKLEALLK